jgi:hypothetical protein
MSKSANNPIRGGKFTNPVSSITFDASEIGTATGVLVALDVFVGAGKIRVNMGNGTRVVVGACVAVKVGV